MTAESYLPAPSLGTLRLATISDVPRIAVIAVAAFIYSKTFEWDRPYHRQYPEDTLRSYEKMFADFVRDPEFVVLVAEDFYQPTEHTKSQAIIVLDPNEKAPQEDEKVIAGVAVWDITANPKRIGQFMAKVDVGSSPVFEGGLGRDKDLEHTRLFWPIVEAEEKRLFYNHMILARLIVHPAYWRRGIGKRLVKWGLELAQYDRVKAGVSTEPRNDALAMYLSLGFVKMRERWIEDLQNPPNKVGISLLECSFD